MTAHLIITRSCDNCGIPILDKDEILCRSCMRPEKAKKYAREEEMKKLRSIIDDAYWRFSRWNAPPPYLQVPEAYKRLAILEDSKYK